MPVTEPDPRRSVIDAEWEQLRDRAEAILVEQARHTLRHKSLTEFVYGMGIWSFTFRGEFITPDDFRRYRVDEGLTKAAKADIVAFSETWSWYEEMFGYPGPMRFTHSGEIVTDW